MLLFGLHPVMVRVTIHANVAITAGQHCSFAAPLDPNCHRWDHRAQPLENAGVAFTNGKRPGKLGENGSIFPRPKGKGVSGSRQGPSQCGRQEHNDPVTH